MKHMMDLLNLQWDGKHVIINEDKEDFTVGVIKHMDYVFDENTYTLPLRVGIQFEEGDVDYREFVIDTIQIKLDERFYTD